MPTVYFKSNWSGTITADDGAVLEIAETTQEDMDAQIQQFIAEHPNAQQDIS